MDERERVFKGVSVNDDLWDFYVFNNLICTFFWRRISYVVKGIVITDILGASHPKKRKKKKKKTDIVDTNNYFPY